MATGHERFERLAVGHVVGGLDAVDNARFRAHLVECEPCRSRVAELRAIDSSLTAAEREERTSAVGSTEVRTRADESAPPTSPGAASRRRWPWYVVGLGLLPTLALLAMAGVVWIRAENQLLAAVNQTQEEVLRVLAAGELVQLTSSSQVRGLAAADPTSVVLDLAALPALAADEGLVVWLLDDAGATLFASAPVLQHRVVDGALAIAMARPAGATELVVTVERLPTDRQAPQGARLLAGPLPALPSPLPAATTDPAGDG